MHGRTNAAYAWMRRSGLQSFCIPPSRQLLRQLLLRCSNFQRPCRSPALPYLPTSLSVAWRSDAHNSMARIVLTCMDALMPRTHGCGGAAYNPFAFPPSRQLLHALPYLPTSLSVAWRSDGGGTTAGMQELEQRGRPAGTLEVRTTHDSMARIVPNNPFAFPPSRQLLHALPYLPTSLSVAWRSDGGGRTASGTAVEEQLSERLPRTASGTAVEERPARVSSAVSCPK